MAGQRPVGATRVRPRLVTRLPWRRDTTWRAGWLAEHAVEDSCVVCSRVESAAARWLRDWLEETHAEPGMVLRLRASMGFCARHTRAVLACGADPTLLTLVLGRVVTEACAMLHQPAMRARTPCPVCVRERQEATAALTMLTDTLRAGRHHPALPVNVALCTDHTLAVMRVLPLRGPGAAAPLRLLADRLAGQLLDCLSRTDPVTVADFAGQADPDTRLRAAWSRCRAELSALHRDSVDADPPTRLRRLLAVSACPVCIRAAVAEHDYLRWLVDRHADGAELERRESLLCPAHLHDLLPSAGVDRALSTRDLHGVWSVIAANVRFWDRRATSFIDGCDRARSRGRVRRRLPEVMTGLQRPPGCRACDAGAHGSERAWQLLHAGVLDADLRADFDRSHGVCFMHGHTLPAADPVRARLQARLQMTRWELDEAGEHARWDQRYDPRGSERSAWSRTPTIIDGTIYCGCPAPR